jgi:transcriptional regulator with XRE-family HTH domain
MSLGMMSLCRAMRTLSKESRREIVALVLSSGYAAKDLAEMMGVSPSAVSRYTRGDLAPSPEALCRMLAALDEELRTAVLEKTVENTWRCLESLIDVLPSERRLVVLEKLAEKLAEKIVEAQSTRNA